MNNKEGVVLQSLVANPFSTQPDGRLVQTEGPNPSQSNQSSKAQPSSVPSSLRNLFGPPQNHNKYLPSSSSFSSSLPRELPKSPLVRIDSPLTSRSHLSYLRVSAIHRSVPSSPEQETRWNTFRGIFDQMSPSPKDGFLLFFWRG